LPPSPTHLECRHVMTEDTPARTTRRHWTQTVAGTTLASLASRDFALAGSTVLKAGELTATIGDNSGTETHRPGYNGIWSLQHAAANRSLFVPGIAGLNLEHIVNGTPLDNDDLYIEPRKAPKTLQQLDETSCELHQPPTPATHLESRTRFVLQPGGILDMHFECWPRRDLFPHGYLSLFWASYINAPQDRSMYFLGSLDSQPAGWCQLCTQFHNDQSTVLHRQDQFKAAFEPDNRSALFRNFSRLRFDQPFFYGRFDDLTWLVLFSKSDGIRLTHSPSGGGFNTVLRSHNPAWDFQFLIREPKVSQSYGFSVRTILQPAVDRNQMVQLAEQWQKERAGTV
ncbi:MAG: hypothetical protein ACKON9_27765, partial [Planctomycetaceae bacterium]